MDETRVDADAQVDAGHERRGLTQRQREGKIVDVRRHLGRQGRPQGFMGRRVVGCAAEHDLAAPFGHEPGREPGPGRVRPEPSRVGAADRQQHPRPAGGQRGDEGRDRPFAFRVDPVLVVAVVDRPVLRPQQVEVAFRLVATGGHGDRRGKKQAGALRGEPDAPRNPGQEADERRGERPLEQVAPRVAARTQPCRPAADAGRVRPRQQGVDVRAVRQGLQGGAAGDGLDHGLGMCGAEVPQEGDRQQRVAEVPGADHDDPLPPRVPPTAAVVAHGGSIDRTTLAGCADFRVSGRSRRRS